MISESWVSCSGELICVLILYHKNRILQMYFGVSPQNPIPHVPVSPLIKDLVTAPTKKFKYLTAQ